MRCTTFNTVSLQPKTMMLCPAKVYLSSSATACLMTNQEYVIPLTEQASSLTLQPGSGTTGAGSSGPPSPIPSMALSTSLKPKMLLSLTCFVRASNGIADASGEGSGGGPEPSVFTGSPRIPLEQLKSLTVELLSAAVGAAGQGVRDPEGGSVELLLVPPLRLFYSLLVMGVFGDEDLGKVLELIEPGVFRRDPSGEEKGTLDDQGGRGGGDDDDDDDEDDDDDDNDGFRKEQMGYKGGKENIPKQGLLKMKLPEAVKLEVNVHTYLSTLIS